MSLRRGAMALGLLAMPLALGGCVAAAIPVIAASGIVARGDKHDSDDAISPVVAVEPKADTALAGAPAPTIESGSPAAAARGGMAELALAPPAAGVGTGIAVAANNSASATGAVFAAQRVNPYAGFYLHAAEQARLDPVDTPRRSAVLATPGALEPVTSDCAILPPAVLVDLDPSGGRIDTAAAFPVNPDLAEVLSALRLQNVAVFWISSASAADAGRVRERLLASGLDPWGRDGLLLMRRADDRKDARRRELSETHCLVAIAGDSRSDFDELFDFLRNPAAAAPLDALMEAGWFLTPAPVSPPAPQTED
ncbi:MAG: hypothetical protein ACK4GD_05535 [Sphingomonadaceae bacterium]